MHGPRVDIYLDRLADNFNYLKSLSSPAQILAVVKANAYGHGAVEISRTLAECGVAGFCVALPVEIQELLDAGLNKPILHLGRAGKSIIELCENPLVSCSINDLDDIGIIKKCLPVDGFVNAHLKIDTGMGRMGCHPDKLPRLISELKKTPQIHLNGVWSHFATAEDPNPQFLETQLKLFNQLAADVVQEMPDIQYRHIANSAAMLSNTSTHLDLVRPGISLYGVSPLGTPHSELKPVMELSASVSLVRRHLSGSTVGYSRSFKLKESTHIAVIQAGYADGIPIAFSNNGTVTAKGEHYPIVGKISMDMTTINCFDNATIPPRVQFWGSESRELRIENLCRKYSMIPYLFLTGISHRVQRVYHS